MDERALGRLRFVTRRHRELQGLRLLVLAPTLVAGFWTQPYVRDLRHQGWMPAALGMFAAVSPWLVLMAAHAFFDKYYEQRFGRVRTSMLQRARDWAPLVLLFAAGLFADIARLTTGAPGAVLVAASAVAVLIVVRDWPHRSYYGLAAALCVAGVWLTATTAALQPRSMPDLARLQASFALLAFLIPAYLDHRLLAATMGRPIGLGEAAPAGERAAD